ncbi:hypothetical protein I4U23_014394 [Adineta vaga]|nr:hypothetical protein I4U23_014394 [Adineta vaga]
MNTCPIYGVPCNNITKICFNTATICDAQFFPGKLCVEDLTKDASVNRFKIRSSSPPLAIPRLKLTDECNGCSPTTPDESIKVLQPSLTSMKSIIVPSYQRNKSQSVKLTHIDLVDLCPKKGVRFADDYGSALNQIKLITTDEIPPIRNEAFTHLQIDNHENPSTTSLSERTRVINYMQPQFKNPVHTSGFNDRLSQQKIVLEQADAIDNRIYGTVKLFSCSLHKQVRIHLTTDNWLSSRDYNATYIPNSYDGTYDRFTFTIDIERDRICTGNNIQFCLCYDSLGGPEYWDNNHQQNYRFDCLSRTIPDFSL